MTSQLKLLRIIFLASNNADFFLLTNNSFTKNFQIATSISNYYSSVLKINKCQSTSGHIDSF